jgi:hypothetical protein
MGAGIEDGQPAVAEGDAGTVPDAACVRAPVGLGLHHAADFGRVVRPQWALGPDHSCNPAHTDLVFAVGCLQAARIAAGSTMS